jgi:alpha-1,3-glucosyltransferase
VAELVISPPSRYPDIYPVLNVLVSTPVFVLTWLWSIRSIIESRWAVGGLGTVPEKGHETNSNADAKSIPSTPVAMTSGAGDYSNLRLRGIGRQQGMRTQSLGFASGGNRKRTVSRTSVAG